MGNMKTFKQLLQKLPNKRLVVSFTEMYPPTYIEEGILNSAISLSEEYNTNCIHFTTNSFYEGIKLAHKKNYLKEFFPLIDFTYIDDISEISNYLNSSYENILVTSEDSIISDNISESFSLIINSIKSNRNILLENSINYSNTGDYENFKKILPLSKLEITSKRLMNEIRMTNGKIPVTVTLESDNIRESYFNKEILQENIVSVKGSPVQVLKRGTNHLLVKENSGKISNQLIKDCKDISGNELEVAKLFAGSFGVSSNLEYADEVVNETLTHLTTVELNEDQVDYLYNFLLFIESRDIMFDPTILEELTGVAKKAFGGDYFAKPKGTIKVDNPDALAASSNITTNDIVSTYDRSIPPANHTDADKRKDIKKAIKKKLEKDSDKNRNKEVNEALDATSRQGIKQTLQKSKTKRDKALVTALQTRATPEVLNDRARRLAVRILKNKYLNGRDPKNMPEGQKQRIDQLIDNSSSTISRLATMLMPRIIKLENERIAKLKQQRQETKEDK